MLEIVSFVSQTCVTLNKHDCCTSKFCWWTWRHNILSVFFSLRLLLVRALYLYNLSFNKVKIGKVQIWRMRRPKSYASCYVTKILPRQGKEWPAMFRQWCQNVFKISVWIHGLRGKKNKPSCLFVIDASFATKSIIKITYSIILHMSRGAILSNKYNHVNHVYALFSFPSSI